MDTRIPLKEKTRLCFSNKDGGVVYYTIKREIGRGNTCLVYEAFYETNTGDKKLVHIKECYPFRLHLKRQSTGILLPNEEETLLFLEMQKRMKQDFITGNRLFYTASLSESFINTLDIYEENNTVYIVSVYSSEQTLAFYHPTALKECILLVKQIAGILMSVHKEGYLYLDLKPENVLISKGEIKRVLLFDFDSFVLKENLETEPVCLSYTKGFAASELQAGQIGRIGTCTDVYGLGALLFYLLFGRTPNVIDGDEDAVYHFEHMYYGGISYQDQLFFSLTDFFHHALASFYLDRYQDMQEVLIKLEELERYADITVPFIQSSHIAACSNFIGREKEEEIIGTWLEQNETQCLLITGMGGIGKSTLIRSYLIRNRQKFDTILYLQYQTSLIQTLTDDVYLHINTVEKRKEETKTDYFKRKFRCIQKLVSKTKTILVIDNYEAEDVEDLSYILNADWKVIIVSRTVLPISDIHILKLDAIADKNSLKRLFEKNLGKRVLEQQYLEIIIKKVAGHTLALELIAKQIAGSYLSLEQAALLVLEKGFSDMAPERIVYEKDNKTSYETIENIISALFQNNQLSESKKILMKILSLFDASGVEMQQIQSMMGFESKEEVNQLIREGWILLFDTRISFHPVIKEVVWHWKWKQEYKEMAAKVMTYLSQRLEIGNNLREYLSYSESILENSKKDTCLRNIQAYRKLSETTILHMPRDREEFILEKSEELLHETIDEHARFNLCRCQVWIYLERKAFPEAYKILKETWEVIRQSRKRELYAPYYNLLGDYYDVKLDGAYDAWYKEQVYNLKMLLKAVDKTIHYAKKSKTVELLVENLLAKATILMRSKPKKKREIQRLLVSVKKLKNDSVKINKMYDMVCAWYFTLVEPNLDRALNFMKKAGKLSEQMKITELDQIDEILLPCANMFCEFADYERAAKLLRKGIEMCEKYTNVIPYERKKKQLYQCLLDIACGEMI